jgi:hypothetical protein
MRAPTTPVEGGTQARIGEPGKEGFGHAGLDYLEGTGKQSQRGFQSHGALDHLMIRDVWLAHPRRAGFGRTDVVSINAKGTANRRP